MYGSDKPAWHRHPNSRVVSGQPDADHAIDLAGMGWLVIKEPVYGENGLLIPSFFATIRDDIPADDSARFLGVVGDRYQVVQNREVLTIADALIGEGGARFETLGSLWGGRQCYATVTLPDDITVKDDLVNKYLVMKWSHDGTCGVDGCITPVRAVCANTVRAAFARAAASVTIRHTSGASTRINEARRILKITSEYYDRVGEVFNSMADHAVDARFVDAYLKSIIPDPKGENAKNTKAENARNRVLKLYNGDQKGGNMTAIRGTAWGLYNATTQFIEYDRTTRTHKNRDEGEARFDAIMWGSGARLRQTAFGLIARQTGIIEGGQTVESTVATN
jgi:phage/plasmid-like protein (TIGR03299 family)